jgi:hypothetical protein
MPRNALPGILRYDAANMDTPLLLWSPELVDHRLIGPCWDTNFLLTWREFWNRTNPITQGLNNCYRQINEIAATQDKFSWYWCRKFELIAPSRDNWGGDIRLESGGIGKLGEGLNGYYYWIYPHIVRGFICTAETAGFMPVTTLGPIPNPLSELASGFYPPGNPSYNWFMLNLFINWLWFGSDPDAPPTLRGIFTLTTNIVGAIGTASGATNWLRGKLPSL